MNSGMYFMFMGFMFLGMFPSHRMRDYFFSLRVIHRAFVVFQLNEFGNVFCLVIHPAQSIRDCFVAQWVRDYFLA